MPVTPSLAVKRHAADAKQLTNPARTTLVAAGSVVDGDVPPHALVAGKPTGSKQARRRGRCRAVDEARPWPGDRA